MEIKTRLEEQGPEAPQTRGSMQTLTFTSALKASEAKFLFTRCARCAI